MQKTLLQREQSIFHVALEKQTYTNMLYLLLSFPLGLIYFVMLVSWISVGLGTLVVWIGVPILALVMSVWWYCAGFERHMAINWLHMEIAPMSIAPPVRGSWWWSLPARLSNPMTWKTLAYLLLKFPLGLCSFNITVSLLALSISITAVSLVIGCVTTPFFILFLAFQNTPDPKGHLQQYLSLVLSAFGLSLLTLRLLNGLAFLVGQLARLLLGMSDTAIRLEAARMLAEQERLRAEQADQRRRELVVNVSHELRAPVASIVGHLESLLLATEEGTQTPPPDTLYNYLGIAHQEARRLGLLVDELLSLARMEAGELRLNIREMAASEVVEEVYQTLMPLAQRERQVTLVRGSLPNLPLVLADRQRLVQVVLNLARNAIISTPAGGIVSLNLELADAQHLALVVEDSGVGIPADELRRIFERFYRTDASRSRATGGFGLGLTIVHDLVTAMGGSVSVASTVGQGSRFCVLLRTVAPK
ncbi:MAG: ATP-binding protein [Ktedonobacteraceae bacterium]